jgi:nucleoside-diphosphate-sugar epimerase
MKEFKGRRIALVGGAGFIGHHLALRLKELGAEPFVIDSLAVNNLYSIKKNMDNMPNAKLYINMIEQRLNLMQEKGIHLTLADARDYDSLSNIIGSLEVDSIVQLAAVSHANRSNKDPFATFDHSFRTLENALDIARVQKLQHFVYLSSSMVYGNFKTPVVTEETHCEPLGIYGSLKYGGEKIVIAYNQVFKLPYTIVRPSALYGPRCVSRRVGQALIENAMQGLTVSINGDGSDRLDFTYINDLVSGLVNVLENENSINQLFNLTYGESRSVAQMTAILKEHFPAVVIKNNPPDELMPSRGTLSVEKAKKLIGYNPQYPLEKGFVEYINWYKGFQQ